jgi:hypothetical protein
MEVRLSRSIRAPEEWWEEINDWAAKHAQSTNAAILLLAQLGMRVMDDAEDDNRITKEDIEEVLARR